MSWHVVGPVMRLNLEGMAKLVLLVYANESDSEGTSIGVAVETAALIAGLSERTVQNYVKGFQADEVLVETTELVGRGRTRIWRLDVKRATALYGRIPTFKERRLLKEKGAAPAPFAKPGKGAGDSLKGAAGSVKGAAPAPTPIKDPIETPGPDAVERAAVGAQLGELATALETGDWSELEKGGSA